MPRDVNVKFPTNNTPQYNIHIAVLVPSTKHATKIAKNEYNKRVRYTVQKLNGFFGGTTRIAGIGSYTSPNKKVIEEEVTIVETFATEASYKEHVSQFKKWLVSLPKLWKQYSIGWEFEEEMHFIES